MSTPPVLHLTRNGSPVASSKLLLREDLGNIWSGSDAPQTVNVQETQPHGFKVTDREPDTEYRIQIGDSKHGPGKEAEHGIGRGKDAVWDDSRYFDGARGRVIVRVASRSPDDKGQWTWRARLPIYVISSKLTDDRYASMTNQVRSLASGLLLDLVSPMFRSLGIVNGTGGVSYRSGLEELRMLEALWASISRQLLEIERNPTTRLMKRTTRRQSWGGDQLKARTLARLAACGVDPRHPTSPMPLSILDERLSESLDTLEHRAIAGLLSFAHRRVASCAQDVLSHRSAIESDRTFREHAHGDGPTLYETEDRPRIAALDEASERADRLMRVIRQARELPLFRQASPLLELPLTPVFEHIRPYREIRDRFLRYFRSSFLMLDGGEQERVKSTHRLYEQWVFFQIASAFRATGLTCISQEGLFHRSHRYRYTLDLDRGAKVTFTAVDGRTIALRYEPWVLPMQAAVQRRDSVFRGRSGEAAWSPDILIEILNGPGSGPSSGLVDYAVVVDAKYTSRIEDHHWSDASKYHDIRATHNRRQVAKQVWLAHLDPSEAFYFADSYLSWPITVDDLPYDEPAIGAFGLRPPDRLVDPIHESSRGWLSGPEPVAREFVDHLLRYRGFPTY